MGLLNEAIREHLELKRLRGADPSEVAREEQDALGKSALRDEEAALMERGVDRIEARSARGGGVFDGGGIYAEADLSPLSQETVELDMRAILEAESIEESEGGTRPDRPRPAHGAPMHARVESPVTHAGDSLEWEIPGEGRPRVGGSLRERGSAPTHRVLDTRKVSAEALAADSLGGSSDEERLWRERRPARDLGVRW